MTISEPTSPVISGASTPLLTFCIPTYNRAASVHRLVTSILANPDGDIQIVVLDNGSTDDTLALLSEVMDPRLEVRSNGTNRGALFNMVNVLSHGTGRYLVYTTDQDRTNVEMIPAFKVFLRSHPDVSCGYCVFESQAGQADEFFAKGYDAVRALAYTGRHPTGYFFRNADLRSIRLVERFSDIDVVDLFPLEFAFAEIGLMGEGAIYHGRLFSPNTGSEVVTHKSSTTNGASKNAFFAPTAKLKMAISFSRHIQKLELSTTEKSMLTAQVFIRELRGATVGFKAVMSNEKLCIHYRMERREVPRSEMLKTGLTFCVRYCRTMFANDFAAVFPFVGSLFKATLAKFTERSGSWPDLRH
jgi:glycosyltransferase involved in cell wall biosynthesis